MNRNLIVLQSLLVFRNLTASAQTLFTYGKYSVDAKDFLRAYNKNNTQPANQQSKSHQRLS